MGMISNPTQRKIQFILASHRYSIPIPRLILLLTIPPQKHRQVNHRPLLGQQRRPPRLTLLPVFRKPAGLLPIHDPDNIIWFRRRNNNVASMQVPMCEFYDGVVRKIFSEWFNRDRIGVFHRSSAEEDEPVMEVLAGGK